MESNKPNALLIGEAKTAFVDSEATVSQGCQLCKNMLEGITLATQKSFETVFVVMSSFRIGLESALGTLRRVSGGAKIILLARMHEEPRAHRITGGRDSKTLADDYYICPVKIEKLLVKTQSGKTTAGEKGMEPPACTDGGPRIEELQRLATEDDLTGSKNRRYVREFLRQIIRRAKKEDLRVTLLIFDIDDFKQYNDTYGHGVGDNVLRQVAVMMGRCCRKHDVIGRVGGDEFAVVFWDCRDVEDKSGSSKKASPAETERRQTEAQHPREAIFMSERFRQEISSAQLPSLGTKGKGVLTISGGLASFPHDGETVDELFEQADKAMLDAKRNGKNRIFLVGEPE